jgi:outer membrane protein insertion porin family
MPDLSAQNQPIISRIVVSNVGPQAISDSLVRSNIRVKEGEHYNRAAIDEDVRNLHATGYFQNIVVLEDRSPLGITLLYVLEAKPRLSDILFSGNKKFSTRKLRKKVTAKVGDPLDERKLFADVQAIRELYQKSGYPQTKVQYVPNIVPGTGRAAVTFEIVETPKVKVEDVYFEGATAFSQKKLRKTIKTRRHWMFSWLTRSGVLKDEQLEDDKEKLAEFYRNEGYIDFELKEVRYVYQTPRKLVLRFVLAEGRRYRVGALDFKGVTLFTTNQVMEKLKMKVGDIFTPKGLNKDIETVQDLYGIKGYIDTNIRVRKTPNIQGGTMDLAYEIEEGDKSFIEKIEIKGNTKTKDRVIRRELAVAPGEVFDMTRVKLSKERLEGLTFFDHVETVPEPTDVPTRKNLVVALSEANTGHFSVGAGFSSLDSILGFVEVSQSNFDLFNPPWFMGGGQKMRLRAALGSVRREYQLSFVEPWFFEKKLRFSVDLYHREYEFVSVNDFYNEQRTGARFGFERALGTDKLIGGISYTIENVGITDVPRDAPQVFKDEEGHRLVSKVGLSLAFDTRGGGLLPNRGQRTELSGEVAGGPFGGETDFYKLELGSHWYFKGLFTGHILEAGGRIGTVKSYSADDVPLFDRFFLGGPETLRGYHFRDVGPREDDEPTGGNTYWFSSVEYSIPIVEFLRFAVFYDIGMVYEDSFSFSENRHNTGFYNDNWGLGIRLNIPRIGPLRLDYGIPITSDPHNGSSGRFQFSVGYSRDY